LYSFNSLTRHAVVPIAAFIHRELATPHSLTRHARRHPTAAPAVPA